MRSLVLLSMLALSAPCFAQEAQEEVKKSASAGAAVGQIFMSVSRELAPILADYKRDIFVFGLEISKFVTRDGKPIKTLEQDLESKIWVNGPASFEEYLDKTIFSVARRDYDNINFTATQYLDADLTEKLDLILKNDNFKRALFRAGVSLEGATPDALLAAVSFWCQGAERVEALRVIPEYVKAHPKTP